MVLVKMIKKYPKLYGKNRTGKIKTWKISVNELSGGNCEILTTHGYETGKKQVDSITITIGKNIGKKNETTPFEQACLQAESKWKSKLDKGYAEDINNIPEKRLPMLAKNYDDYKHKITYPCFVQPKLDGVRCLAKRVGESITFTSRKGKPFKNLSHLVKELLIIMDDGETYDGEIYIHKENFQDIISTLKNSKKDGALNVNQLEYHIYDIANSKLDYKDRKVKLYHTFLNNLTNNLYYVITYPCEDEKKMLFYHDMFVRNGYEGCILRNKLGKYEFDYRSDNLQKYKHFQDEEFEIIDVISGTGRYANAGTFVCKTPEDKQFNVNPKGTMKVKEEYLTNKDNYIGQLLTVKFQEKSKDNIPRFPVGISVRNYE